MQVQTVLSGHVLRSSHALSKNKPMFTKQRVARIATGVIRKQTRTSRMAAELASQPPAGLPTTPGTKIPRPRNCACLHPSHPGPSRVSRPPGRRARSPYTKLSWDPVNSLFSFLSLLLSGLCPEDSPRALCN